MFLQKYYAHTLQPYQIGTQKYTISPLTSWITKAIILSHSRNSERYPRPFSLLTVQENLTIHCFHQTTSNLETEASTSNLLRGGMPQASEGLKKCILLRTGNADSSITDGDRDHARRGT